MVASNAAAVRCRRGTTGSASAYTTRPGALVETASRGPMIGAAAAEALLRRGVDN